MLHYILMIKELTLGDVTLKEPVNTVFIEMCCGAVEIFISSSPCPPTLPPAP
jgi:hypothetical protein